MRDKASVMDLCEATGERDCRAKGRGLYLSSSESPSSADFSLDDLASAAVPGSRLNNILVRVRVGLPLSLIQQRFLEEQRFGALLGLSRGTLSGDEFISMAQAEQRARIAASAESKEVKEQDDRLLQEASDRRNAELFAESERKWARRKLFANFGLGYVEPEHFSRVRRIVREAANGAAIQAEDLIWLGAEGLEYWTAELRCAHHRILAEQFSREWRESGDPWKAVNACSQWRKAKVSSEALATAGEALARAIPPKVRSALLTTSGGALRDLGRHREGVRHGTEAHALCPDDYRPCTLLGAIHIEIHAFSEGAAWYEKAEARGAPRSDVDQEIRAILAAARPEERETIRRELKAYDALRYEAL